MPVIPNRGFGDGPFGDWHFGEALPIFTPKIEPLRTLFVTIGDDFYRNRQLATTDGVPYELTGCTLWFTARKQLERTDASALIKLFWEWDGDSDGITVENGEYGMAVIQLTPAQTATLEPGAYYYDLQLKDFGGIIHTIDHGVLVAKRSATMRTTTP